MAMRSAGKSEQRTVDDLVNWLDEASRSKLEPDLVSHLERQKEREKE